MLTGLVLGALPIEPRLSLTRDLLFAIVLAGLVFEAAVHLREEWLTDTRASIAALAVPGVVAALGLTAWMLLRPARSFTPTFTVLDALFFAAATVATDPIAVVATFRSLKVPPRLAVLVEGESLLNDGTGVVAFKLADWKLILLGYVVITLVRVAIVSATSAALRRTREAIPWRWTFVVGWSGG